MNILVELTYYRPHTSGLTIYAERLAKALVRKGHKVTVLTSRYDPSLPSEENMDGVHVVRAPVLFRISKGVVMPTFGLIATQLVLQNDVIHLHLPQFDAAGLALRGRMLKKPTLITYHCDLQMPSGVLSWAANQAVNMMNHIASAFTHRVIAYTNDYAEHSPLLKKFSKKIEIINPPVDLPSISTKEIKEFKEKRNPEGKYPVIGMAARFASEKGVEVLLNSLERIRDFYPDVQVWFAGPYKNILGEEEYYRRLRPVIEKFQSTNNWKFLGLLAPDEMAAFYPNLDMLVIPSLNSTEAFGLVQIEAMMNGVPSIASNLPGVRRPVQRHDMGIVIPIGDASALADAVIEIARHPQKYSKTVDNLNNLYSPDSVASEYEALFRRLLADLRSPVN